MFNLVPSRGGGNLEALEKSIRVRAAATAACLWVEWTL